MTRDGVWPTLSNAKNVRCIALFIDIRGSSAMSAKTGDAPQAAARRTQKFLEQVSELWMSDEVRGPTPNAVRSYGDGLFCVWEMPEEGGESVPTLKGSVLQATINLNKLLPERLAAADDFLATTEVGMGLAYGDVSAARLGEISDYYGYVVNLASKIQSLARPGGLVVHPSMGNGLQFGLVERHFDVGLGSRPELFFTTETVRESHEWTCLAWPGFAKRKHDLGGPGLNMLGITVLTHEGLQGKIGSLEIWHRNIARESRGDTFEVIIDDNDSLEEMHRMDDIRLSSAEYDSHDVYNENIGCLSPSRDKFFFMPIRCGLNAIAWHDTVNDRISGVRNMREIIECGIDCTIGLYDNMGATLPMLVQAIYPHKLILNLEKERLKTLIGYLAKEQERIQHEHGENARLFQLYAKIEDLGKTLQVGNDVKVVIGGGAWLTNPLRTGVPRVTVGLPGDIWGFVWTEGAAVVGAQVPDPHLVQFLQRHLLKTTYQTGLLDGPGYGCCPVTREALQPLIGEDFSPDDYQPGPLQTAKEARMIFDPNGWLRPKLLMRRAPLDIVEWRRTWEVIRKDFCNVHGR